MGSRKRFPEECTIAAVGHATDRVPVNRSQAACDGCRPKGRDRPVFVHQPAADRTSRSIARAILQEAARWRRWSAGACGGCGARLHCRRRRNRASASDVQAAPAPVLHSLRLSRSAPRAASGEAV